MRIATIREIGLACQIQRLLFVERHHRWLVGGSDGIRSAGIVKWQAVHDEDRVVRSAPACGCTGVQMHETPAFNAATASGTDHVTGVFGHYRHRLRCDIDHEESSPTKGDVRVLARAAGDGAHHDVIRPAGALLQRTARCGGRLVVAVFAVHAACWQSRVAHGRKIG